MLKQHSISGFLLPGALNRDYRSCWDMTTSLALQFTMKMPYHREAWSCSRCRKRGFDPWAGKIPWRRNDNLLQCSCLGNPVDKGDWWGTVQGVTKE